MLRAISATLVALLTFGQLADAAGMFPLSRQQVFRAGKPVGGARLFLFDGGTSTPRIGYKDLSLSSPHPNPIVADADGRIPMVFLSDGYYRQRLTTSTGTLIFDDDGIPVLTTSAGGSGTTVDPDAVLKTGDYKLGFNDQPQSGFVRANGRTIGSTLSGATERANADTQPLYEHLWQFSNISVTGGKGANAAADYAANKPLVLPDASGRGLFGSDDLGAGARGILTSTYCTGPAIPGSACGAQTATILPSWLPVTSPWVPGAVSVSGSGTTGAGGSHAHVVAGNTVGVNSNHVHSYLTAANKNFVVEGGSTQGNVWGGGDTAATTGNDTPDHSHAFSTTSDTAPAHTHSVSINSIGSVSLGSNAGGGQAFSRLPPIITIMIYLRL